MRLSLILPLIAAVAAVAIQKASGDVIIDDFQDTTTMFYGAPASGGPFTVPPDPGVGTFSGPFTQQTAGANILGGFRDTMLQGTVSNNQSILTAIGGGSLTYGTGDDTFGDLKLNYDGGDGPMGTLLPALGTNQIVKVPFSSLDTGTGAGTVLDVIVTVTDSDGDTQSLSDPRTAPGTVDFDFTSFAGMGAGQLNFDSLDSIMIQFTGNPQSTIGGGIDFTIDSPVIASGTPTTPTTPATPAAVPEPATVLVLSLLLVVGTGLGFVLIPNAAARQQQMAT